MTERGHQREKTGPRMDVKSCKEGRIPAQKADIRSRGSGRNREHRGREETKRVTESGHQREKTEAGME